MVQSALKQQKTEYNIQVDTFLKETQTKLTTRFIEHKKYFSDDKESRDVFKILLKRGNKQYSFTFGQSIANVGQDPTVYDVLVCLQNYEVGTLQDFCNEFDYDIDSIKIGKIYKAVVKEYAGVRYIWTIKEIEKLAEIQ